MPIIGFNLFAASLAAAAAAAATRLAASLLAVAQPAGGLRNRKHRPHTRIKDGRME